MPISVASIDRQPLEDVFGSWRDEQSSLATQIEESVSALGEYQSHLESWQEELDRKKEKLEREHGSAQQLHEQVNLFKGELTETRQKLTDLSSELLAKTEELRTADKTIAGLTAELKIARIQEKEVAATDDIQESNLTGDRVDWSTEIKEMRALLEARQETSTPVPAEPPVVTLPLCSTPGDPVLDSVIAQFDKLRKQQASGRKSKK